MSHEVLEVQPRARRRQANLARILDAATHIVMAEGLEALSIKRVADEADYTAGALYRYYPSKNALLTAVVIRVIGEFETRLATLARALPPDAPLTHVFAQVHSYCRFSVEQHNAYALLSRMAAEPRVLLEDLEDAAAIMVAIMRALTPLAQALEAAATAGALAPGDATERTMLLYAGLQGVLQLRKQERLAGAIVIDADHMAAVLVRTLLRGWEATDEALDAAEAEARALSERPAR
ncbi:MAG: TetR/AcrR family transcriptional regulator [Deltaproteobacteria bacterium]|nr:TetR/AcrR family transcriptional regulator [Deltaproteobacteria bacterium]